MTISDQFSILLDKYQHALSMKDCNAQKYDYCIKNNIQHGLCGAISSLSLPRSTELLLMYSVVVLRRNVIIHEYFWPTPTDRIATGIGFNESLTPRIKCLKWMIKYHNSNYFQKLLIHIKYKLYKENVR